MALESSQQYNRELYEYSQQIEEDENDEETLQQDTRTPSLPMQSDNQQKSKKKQYNTTKKTTKRKENTIEDTSDEETTDLSDLSDWIEIPWSMWSAIDWLDDMDAWPCTKHSAWQLCRIHALDAFVLQLDDSTFANVDMLVVCIL